MTKSQLGFIRCPERYYKLLFKKCREQEVVWWRQVIMYAMYEEGKSKTEIGKFFKKSHATVIHSIDNVKIALEGYHSQLLEVYNIAFGDVNAVNNESECVHEKEACGLVLIENLKNKNNDSNRR